MPKPVCAVVGVGPGNGAALARRFSSAGYAIALLARSTDLSTKLAAELHGARPYQCDIADATAVAATFDRIRRDLGDVDVFAYNAGSGTWGTVEEISPEAFESAWRVNTLGLLLAAKQVVPAMKQKAAGNIVVIGATASRRGMPRTAAFAPAKAAQLSLAQSMARHLWPAGIHVSVIILDGVVDLARSRRQMPDKPDDFFIKPEDVAETAWWLTQQKRSAWSFEVEARPFGERW
jgi:NAD(P)-dependent dehydrogenase (short-subunit alcohol dehydrogenase family)